MSHLFINRELVDTRGGKGWGGSGGRAGLGGGGGGGAQPSSPYVPELPDEGTLSLSYVVTRPYEMIQHMSKQRWGVVVKLCPGFLLEPGAPRSSPPEIAPLPPPPTEPPSLGPTGLFSCARTVTPPPPNLPPSAPRVSSRALAPLPPPLPPTPSQI